MAQNYGKTTHTNAAVSTEKKKELAKKLKSMQEKDRELVKGIFNFYEVPGGVLEFSYKAYAGDPVENFSLRDGQIYSLPLGVAKHLNKNVSYPQYEYMKGEDVIGGYNSMNNQGMRVCKKIKRCSFQSLEFLDIDDLDTAPKKIIEVEQVILNG